MRSMARTTGLTYADLLAYDDDVRREIIDGELFVTPSPRLDHQEVVGRLHLLIGPTVRDRGLGRVYLGPSDVVFEDRTVCVPDLLFVATDRLEQLTEMHVQGSPSLVIEVVSDPRHDRVRKRAIYERFGVPEYWIVDPDADRVEVYRLEDDRYGKPEILEPGDTLSTHQLPGLEIDLTELFRLD